MNHFDWLPMSDRKNMPAVRVLFRDIDCAGGFFVPRTAERCIDDGFDIDRGEADHIILSTYWGDPHGSTIAHEHRHFQQYYSTVLPQLGEPLPFGDNNEQVWRANIKRFYLSQPWELDALLYSMKHHPDAYSEPQLEAVYSHT